MRGFRGRGVERMSIGIKTFVNGGFHFGASSTIPFHYEKRVYLNPLDIDMVEG